MPIQQQDCCLAWHGERCIGLGEREETSLCSCYHFGNQDSCKKTAQACKEPLSTFQGFREIFQLWNVKSYMLILTSYNSSLNHVKSCSMFGSHLSTRRTTIAQKLPHSSTTKRYIIRLTKKHWCELGSIANADRYHSHLIKHIQGLSQKRGQRRPSSRAVVMRKPDSLGYREIGPRKQCIWWKRIRLFPKKTSIPASSSWHKKRDGWMNISLKTGLSVDSNSVAERCCP